MNAIIIEDEQLAAERLEELINEVDSTINISAKLTSVKDSIDWLRNNKTELIFLDIQLSDGLSFSIFEKIEVTSPIIFTTAYDQYAIKAFELNSIDYLLKPVRKNDLEDALNKLANIKRLTASDFEKLLLNYSSPKAEYKSRFLVQYGSKLKKIEIADVAYFFAEQKSVFLKTFANEQYPIDYSLDKLLEKIDPNKFFRINRKLIVNISAIKNMIPYSRSRIKLELEPTSPKSIEPIVSIERSSDFKEWLNK